MEVSCHEEDMKTMSLCPECLAIVEAEVYEKGGKIILKKRCEKHGKFDDVYWSDASLFKKFSNYRYEGKGAGSNIEGKKGCPYDCGLCLNHKSSTILANIDLTNRCNQRCPTCFANASASGYLYEPKKEEIRRMLEVLRMENPPCPAVQFAGGEPTMRKDLPEIINMARELGFSQVQIATNGIRLANSEELCEELMKAGLHTVYLQFDGVKEEAYEKLRGRKGLKTKLKAIENSRKGGLKSVVLVPTLAKGINDDQIGKMISFAAENLDVIKGVNVQPVSFAGRVEEGEREKMRITIPDFVKLVEEKTEGKIPKDSFYPVPFVLPFSYFVEAWKKEPQIEFTVHPHCGVATYVIIENGKFIPITNFVDVEGFMEFIKEEIEELGKSKIGKMKVIAKMMLALKRFVDKEKAPEGFDLTSIINILREGNRESTAEFHRKTLFIAAMHFMDAYNFDLERVKRCGIHYVTPDLRIIPFCAYNTIHREAVENAFSMPFKHL